VQAAAAGPVLVTDLATIVPKPAMRLVCPEHQESCKIRTREDPQEHRVEPKRPKGFTDEERVAVRL